MATFDVVLECGTKRTFASAVDWPGWCRPARTELDALAALLEYGPKYLRCLRMAAWVWRRYGRAHAPR